MKKSLLAVALCTGAAPAAAQCLEQHLPPPSSGARFGAALAVRADDLFVGSESFAGHGSVTHFARDAQSSEWVAAQLLTPSVGSGAIDFGKALAFDGGDLVVGSPRDSTFGPESGAVYVFRHAGSGAGWTLVQQLAPSVLDDQMNFGEAVAIDGDTLIVGAPLEDVGPQTWIGAAYVFERDPVSLQWSEVARFPWPGPGGWQFFAQRVAVSGDWCAAATPNAGTPGQDHGEVHLFRRTQGTWTPHSVLSGTVPSSDKLGEALALRGEWLVVTSKEPVPYGGGRVRVHRYDAPSDSWTPGADVTPGGGVFSPGFGDQLSFDGTRLVVASHVPAAHLYEFDPLAGTFTFVRWLTWIGAVSVVGAPRVAHDDAHVLLGRWNGGSSGAAQVLGSALCGALGARVCTPAAPNSSGLRARLDAYGNAALDRELFVLRASRLPRDEFGMFLASQAAAQLPVGAGVLCVGHPFVRFRFQAGTTNTAGYIEKELDLAHLPTFPGSSVLPGETWYFQAWFRDGQTSNFTDALEVPFI